MSQRVYKQTGIALYHQVETYIREKIDSGQWGDGYKLPTENELASFFDVSRTTIRQAVDSMVQAGQLIRRQGSGTYVSRHPYARKRLRQQLSDDVCRYIYAPFIELDIDHSYRSLLMVNICHALMLWRQKLITQDEASAIVSFLLPLLDKHPETIGTNPANEDYLLNFEQYLISNLGLELGGRLQLGRSRNDMTPTILRMSVRDNLLTIYKNMIDLISTILDLAEKNEGRVLPSYTHHQPSQPITLDHYLLGVAEALSRDLDRLLFSYKNLNLSPLGACAIAGTSHMIDRRYTARLLGFDDIVTNSLDAVSSRDFLLQTAADFVQAGSNISRFTEDLYLWATEEFGYVSFSDATSCCSTIMPQKRNPVSVEHIKSRSGHLTAAYLDMVMCLKGTVFSHSRDLFDCTRPYWQCIEDFRQILVLLIDVLHDITFNYERMKQRAEESHITLTDVADQLVRQDGLSFRQAHSILSSVAKDFDQSNGELTLDRLNEACREAIGRNSSLSEDDLIRLSSPENSVRQRVSEGSPSPESCKKMLLTLRSQTEQASSRVDQITVSLRIAEDYAKGQINELTGI